MKKIYTLPELVVFEMEISDTISLSFGSDSDNVPGGNPGGEGEIGIF